MLEGIPVEVDGRSDNRTAGQADGQSPFITIAIPTYNRSTWLKSCVEAALAQTYGWFEVLVSDNASTDATQEVLAGVNDTRLRVIQQPENIGLLPNWNACLDAARGEYIAVVSDDDAVSPEFLSRCAELIRKEPGIAIVVAQSEIEFLPEGRKKPPDPNPNMKSGLCDGTDILHEFLSGRISAQMCGNVLRVDALRAAGGFRLDFPHAGDIVSWVPLLLKGAAGYIDEGLVTYRVHAGARTLDFSDEAKLAEVRRFTNLLTEQAAVIIKDDEVRRRITRDSRFFLAITALYRLELERKSNSGLLAVLQGLWKWRAYFSGVGTANLYRLAKPLAFLLLPAAVIRTLQAANRSAGLPEGHKPAH